MRRTAEMAEGNRRERGRRERIIVEITLTRIPEYLESKEALAKQKLT